MIWGVWHTPYFLLPGSAQSNFPYLAYVLLVVAQSVMYGWLHKKTGGSVLLAALFHAATNAALAYTAVGVGDERAFWLLTAVTWVAAIAGLFMTGTLGKPLPARDEVVATPAVSR